LGAVALLTIQSIASHFLSAARSMLTAKRGFRFDCERWKQVGAAREVERKVALSREEYQEIFSCVHCGTALTLSLRETEAPRRMSTLSIRAQIALQTPSKAKLMDKEVRPSMLA
jgi:hypothetical protein